MPSELKDRIAITPDLSGLNTLMVWLNNLSEAYNLGPRTLFRLDMVINELIPNVISYAFVDHTASLIIVELTLFSEKTTLEIRDKGIAFDPLQVSYESAETLETASIGGRGIHLVKQFSDHQTYFRQFDENVLICEFYHQDE